MVFFKDFGKTVTDLFDSDKYRLNRTLQVTAANSNTEWKTKTVINADGTMKNKLVYKQSDKCFGCVEATIPTKGALEVDYCTPKLADGLKTNVVVKQPNVDIKAKFTKGAFKHHSKTTMNFGGSLDAVYADASYNFDGFMVGGAVKMKPNSESLLADYNVGMEYRHGKDTICSVSTKDRMEKISTGFWRRVSARGELAARFNVDLNETSQPSVEVGSRWKVDDSGTFQAVMKTGGDAMMLYKHKVNKRVTASLGACFDTKALSADTTKLHYKLEYLA